MHMTFRHFMVFVCDLMACLAFFCLFMQQKPVPGTWAIVGFSAFLVIVLICTYFFLNFVIDTFVNDGL